VAKTVDATLKEMLECSPADWPYRFFRYDVVRVWTLAV
jgi:hypothetical protein